MISRLKVVVVLPGGTVVVVEVAEPAAPEAADWADWLVGRGVRGVGIDHYSISGLGPALVQKHGRALLSIIAGAGRSPT